MGIMQSCSHGTARHVTRPLGHRSTHLSTEKTTRGFSSIKHALVWRLVCVEITNAVVDNTYIRGAHMPLFGIRTRLLL